jgi:T5SS/PEP-CTERM-associated repeat protein
MNAHVVRTKLAVILAVSMWLACNPAYAVKFWKNSVPSGNWSTGNNWSATSPGGADFAGVPGLSEPVRIYNTNGAAHTVTLDTSPPALGLLVIDLPAAGALTNTLSLNANHSLTAAGIFVGGHNGTGVTSGRGTLTQSAGTINTSAGSDLYLGSGAGSTGVYNLSGGSLNANLSTVVGSLGTGTFNHSGGIHTLVADAIGGGFFVGYQAGSNGTYNLSGTGQLVSNKNEHIGLDGVGQFFQTGGTHTVSGSHNFHLGTNPGGQGTYNLSAGSLTTNNYQFIGYAGVGQFNQTGGTNNVPNLILADRATGQGAYAISGGTLTVGSSAVVGLLGTASMNITGTGVVNIANDLAINNSSNVTLNGGTLRFNTISGLNRLIWQSGTLRLAGFRAMDTDPTLAAVLGNPKTIANGKNLIIEGQTHIGTTSLQTVNVSNAQFTTLGELRLGINFGGNVLNITTGATVTNAAAVLGIGSFGAGTVNVSGSSWTTGPLRVGEDGYGEVNITNGATVNSTDVYIGVGSSAPASKVVVSGIGSTWTADFLNLGNGYLGSHVLNIQTGGKVSLTTNLRISTNSAVNLNGGSLRFDTISSGDEGRLYFNSGTIQLSQNRDIGADPYISRYYGLLPVIPSGKGLTVEGAATLTKPLNIDGGTFKTNGLTIGAGGSLNFQSGVLEISGGSITGLAQLNIPTNGEFRAVGNQTVRVAAAVGSTITPTGLLVLGDFNAVNGFYTNGTVNVGANTLALADANDAVFDSAALVTLGGSGPGQLDALNGLTLNFGANITGHGEVYTSNAIVTPLINNGHITGASTAQRITLPGYVKGVGTFDNVNFTGTFAPGLSPTSLVVGNVGLSNTSTLVMEIGGTSPGSSYDQIISSGALALDGALQIALINGFTPSAGQSFNLFDWSTASGTFDSLQLPTLPGLSWDTSQLYTQGIISLASAGLPGDYNQNGSVDAADYSLWRDRLGSGTALPNDDTAGVGPDDYTRWKNNFGNSAGSGSSAHSSAGGNVASVPEPSAHFLLLILSLAAIHVRRYREPVKG